MSNNHVVGILAHVDAGKTTLSEQLLFHAGVLRAPGRVDHRDAFLDAHPLERQRGITIFSDQAVFERNGHRFFWVDTPGHADFAAEMERALSVLDMAVLVVNGAEGIQSHTETLWDLLAAYGVPTVLFINKTDRPACDAAGVLAQLKGRLSVDAVDMGGWHGGDLPTGVAEAVAERDEALLDRWLADAYEPAAWLEGLRRQVADRQLFPVYRGSALNDVGVAELLDALCLLCGGGNIPPQNTVLPSQPDETVPFRALCYKVRHDAQGGRVCFFKVLAGVLKPREEFPLADGTDRVNELRLYNGSKFTPIPQAEAGMLCAAPGLSGVRPGDVIGHGGGHNRFHTEPMMAASALWDPAVPVGRVLAALRRLEDEDPALAVSVDERTGGIDLRVMGRIQLEVIRQLMRENFGIEIDFGPMRVLYMETIATPAVGVGHYEPLRHYAEVQLRLVPGPQGSGIRFESLCHVDELALNWQRLIETHVFEREHHGVLTGSPLTDVTVVLLQGRAHLKHTEGGDFRQAVYRAIRNALMGARSVLLEPLCAFEARFSIAAYGAVTEAMASIGTALEPPEVEDERVTLRGEAPYALFQELQEDFPALIRGRGTLRVWISRYAPCRDQAAAVAEAGYNPLADPEDTPESVFCAHGAGFNVAWDRVRDFAHLPPPET